MSELVNPVIETPTDDEVVSKQGALELSATRMEQYEVRYSPSEARFTALQQLERITGEDYSVDQLKELEARAHDYTPTLGIEIEIYDKALLSKDERALSPDEKAAVIADRKGTLRDIERAGLPRDKSDEEWWEFALKPTRTPELLVAEVQALEDAGVLHSGERYYPLHITLG